MPGGHPAGRRGSPEDLVRALRAEEIRDRRVLAAFGEVPRAGFVPPAAASQAYLDEPIRIPHGQVTTQPSLIAKEADRLVTDVELVPARFVPLVGAHGMPEGRGGR